MRHDNQTKRPMGRYTDRRRLRRQTKKCREAD